MAAANSDSASETDSDDTTSTLTSLSDLEEVIQQRKVKLVSDGLAGT